MRKGNQATTNHIQVVTQREPHPRSHKVRYSFSDEEGELSDTDDEIQGHLCVSVDPRRSGSTEGGENFILTSDELRLSLQSQCHQISDFCCSWIHPKSFSPFGQGWLRIPSSNVRFCIPVRDLYVCFLGAPFHF